MIIWDLVVVGGGPAGLSAAHAAARSGVRTLVVERATHPRYKTCGGGLIGTSLAEVADRLEVPAHDRVDRITFTRDGRRAFTRRHPSPLVTMIRREEFDDRLRAAAVAAGAQVREGVAVRAVEQDPDEVRLRLADGEVVRARAVIGADGSSGVTARHVGVRFRQVDLGLELELPVDGAERERWRGRVLLDWGPLPGSYAWVFPKGDRLTVGVISARGDGDRTRAYLRDFTDRLGLSGVTPEHDSGHLTRCRADDSPLRHGRVLVAGDAAGLLEPWSREGISYALRSGRLAGEAVAGGDLGAYAREVGRRLTPEMRAGHRLLETFERRPDVFHAMLASPPGWRMFVRFCQGRASFAEMLDRRPVRAGLAVLDRLPARARAVAG
ncbi:MULTISPECIES: geranylgeranyl reductase family protein [Micromonospora]|uniref:geranylgeranyl reductase family protein n=1 Tax=Micromonospora TaxID=1873 RepID=UPI000CE4F959|nr:MULTISPECIES: geranylgeranyl reductase family protein [Micromonospora]MBQ1068608.1 geranylgeranyl reductase family protein [Micromonospora sp. D75]MCK1810131.1 geranylgeranyl reductase family protein [Micromonospora sp. R42106]MCK1835338.1 geranylgeranyl reductase family protein [Micromonospora sp. R42003]MCK1847256.1 geranylgeranyl reductase family protein [Micromonospora sp. R42004]MCM1016264.1 geranylgeranyl reductase family protein [Micromonospora sp. XM-20-01]